MNKFAVLSCLLIFVFNSSLTSQSRLQNRKKFVEAESWILFEDYKEALPLYQQLVNAYPQNYNFKYRTGQCYLNIPGEKDKAIGFLEEAVKNINPEYKAGKFREKGAPHDALFYLGNAYMINYKLDKAIESFNLLRQTMDDNVYDTSIVSFQIQSCHTAKELMDSPIFMKEQNLGEPINENFSEFSPVVSDDETMMVFSRSFQFYDAILFSDKVDGRWTTPLNMNELLKVDRDFYPSSVARDGKTLYLYSSLGYDGNIYITRFNNDIWSPPVMLNNNINTKYWESHATVTHDDKKLFFTSNRRGGYGGLDIYFACRDSTGDWGTPVNMGPVINTRYNENTPFLSSDEKTLFFSSRGHLNMGGYDIFYTTLLDNVEWSAPVNAGYPMNSTDDDLFYKPVYDGFVGYLARYDPDGAGGQDIYRIEIFNDKHPRKFFITGNAKVADNAGNQYESVGIKAIPEKKTEKEIVAFSDPETGDFAFVAPHGKYEIIYEAKNSEKIVKNYSFPLRHPSDSFHLPGTVLQKIPGVADLQYEEGKKTAAGKPDVPGVTRSSEKRPRSFSPVAAGTLSSKGTQVTETPVDQASLPSKVDTDISRLSEKTPASGETTEEGRRCRCPMIWILVGLLILLLIIFGIRRSRKKNKKEEL
jgi:tetratricopeptide (TPR) repeat protein